MSITNRSNFYFFCKEKGLTAAEVAERLECSKSAVHAYWYGQRLPSRRTMRRMEQELGIDTRRMFGL